MTPTTSSAEALRTHAEAAVRRKMANIAPAIAADAVARSVAPAAVRSMTAAPSPAPALMPRMEGSARGLRKSVCITSPPTASAAPESSAVHAAGRRLSRMMNRAVSLPPPQRVSTASDHGSGVGPESMFSAKSSTTQHVSVRVRSIFYSIGVFYKLA